MEEAGERMNNIKDLLKEMKESVGTKEPTLYFDKLTDVLGLLTDKIDKLEVTIERTRIRSALAIQWEPKIAADMLVAQISLLREDKETYHVELSALKVAYAEGKVTQNYNDFCQFWIDTLGWHPFLD